VDVPIRGWRTAQGGSASGPDAEGRKCGPGSLLFCNENRPIRGTAKGLQLLKK
jgi:hypothetical protein